MRENPSKSPNYRTFYPHPTRRSRAHTHVTSSKPMEYNKSLHLLTCGAQKRPHPQAKIQKKNPSIIRHFNFWGPIPVLSQMGSFEITFRADTSSCERGGIFN